MANPVEHEIHERKICKRDSNHFFFRPKIDHLFCQCKCFRRRHFAPFWWHRPYRLLQHRVRCKMALPIFTWFRLPTNFMPTIIRKCLFLASRALLFQKRKQKKKGGEETIKLSSNSTWLLVGSWLICLKNPPMFGKLRMSLAFNEYRNRLLFTQNSTTTSKHTPQVGRIFLDIACKSTNRKSKGTDSPRKIENFWN